MNSELLENYWLIRDGGFGWKKLPRGLFAVWGKEAEQFLNGLITNDVKTLDDGSQMLAAFPNAQGRLLAVVRVTRQDERFLLETEEATREKVWNNIFRFTFAGDFFAEDLSENCQFFSTWNLSSKLEIEGALSLGNDVFIPKEFKPDFSNGIEISDELFEILRIEEGIPLYGVDMDETTIVPELGQSGMVSYNKGCYIGQEIIARIYFRGHVAKQLRGLVLSEPFAVADGLPQIELKSIEGKNAGKITSGCYSPKLEKNIALGYVRYDYLAEGTELRFGEVGAAVRELPFGKAETRP